MPVVDSSDTARCGLVAIDVLYLTSSPVLNPSRAMGLDQAHGLPMCSCDDAVIAPMRAPLGRFDSTAAIDVKDSMATASRCSVCRVGKRGR